DRSPASRSLIAKFDASPNFTIVNTVNTVAEIDRYLQRGDAWIALAIPTGYGTALAAGRPVALQIIADGSDSNLTNRALGYATAPVGEYAQALLPASGEPAAAPIDLRMRVFFNPQLESRYFMIPGVLALLLLLVTTNLAAMAIVREKELGTLEQLNVTPLR